MPVTSADATGSPSGGDPVTGFAPDNLCVHQGGSVDLKEIGGFQYGGSPTAPPDPAHYRSGTPYRIFSSVASSTTARFTGADATNNGQTVSPQTDNQTPGRPVGSTTPGEEMLMQVTLATDGDRSPACGGGSPQSSGPTGARNPKPTAMRIKPQSLFVSKSRTVIAAAYCPSGVPACTGTSTLTHEGKKIASTRFGVPRSKTAHIAMKITKVAYKAVVRAKKKPMAVTWTLVTPHGTYRQAISLHR
jgi:hypothetical protein